MNFSEVATVVKTCAEALGYACAGSFFVFKFISGYLVTNLSLSIRCGRYELNGDVDRLIITAGLKKGDRNTVLLHDAQARVTYGTITKKAFFEDVERRSMKRVDFSRRQSILWEKRSKKAPFLRMSPSEETEFTTFCDVPRSSICKIEIAILGARPFSRKFGQWRASIICHPKNGNPSLESAS